MTGDKKGFTLVEVLVATGVFVFIITITVSIYVTTIAAQNRTFARQNVLDSSRFALESMARAIRQSTISSAGTESLTIENHPTKGTVTYSLVAGRLQENGAALTAENVSVDEFKVRTDGTTDGDLEQPRVTILLEVRSTNAKDNEQASIPIQTTITPRGLDL